MRILVTGGNGFIGRRVVAALRERSHEVRVLTTGPAGAGAFHADLRQDCDLGPALLGVDAVVHCAAAMGGSLDKQRAITVDGTRRLLAAMEAARVRRIVLLSTFSVYDVLAVAEGSVLDEDSPLVDPAAADPYARAKREQEDLVHASAARWRLGRRLWIGAAGDSLLPLTYVENCAEAITLAVESESAVRAVLNLVDDDLPSRRGFLEALARRTTPRPRISWLSWRLVDRLARLLRRPDLQARYKPLRYSNARVKSALGWRPRWDLAAALERTFAAARSTGV
jgi:nucleoside-diphosphate-sugar epimerase